jgi:hypothetical protein
MPPQPGQVLVAMGLQSFSLADNATGLLHPLKLGGEPVVLFNNDAALLE